MPEGISFPESWHLWQDCVIRLLRDLVSGNGVCSITCRRPAGWWSSTTIPGVLCVLSPSPVHCLHQGHIVTKLKERLLEEVFPFQLGWTQCFVREVLSVPSHLFSPLRFTCLYDLQEVVLCLLVVLPVLRRIIKSSNTYWFSSGSCFNSDKMVLLPQLWNTWQVFSFHPEVPFKTFWIISSVL